MVGASTLNFVVAGEVRSGTTVVQSTLDGRPGCVCHGDLFHADDQVRLAAHEAYFGPARPGGRSPEHFSAGGNPWQYLTRTVFDNPRRGEKCVGVRLHYPVLHRWELFDLIAQRAREGDFCLVHVRRNPVACLVSLRQAERGRVWVCPWEGAVSASSPLPVSLEARDLVEFCRAHAALAGKLKAACADTLEVPYTELHRDYRAVMRRLFDFLELPDSDAPVRPGCRRLRNRCILDRLSNAAALRRALPSDVRALLEAEDLF